MVYFDVTTSIMGEKITPSFETLYAKEAVMMREKLIREAVRFLGAPSVAWTHDRNNQGKNLKEGVDCAGYISALFDRINFPKDPEIRIAGEYFDQFGIPVHEGLQMRGDLVFFTTKGEKPNQMGLMLDEVRFIQSPGVDNEVVSIGDLNHIDPVYPLEIPYFEGQLYNRNPIGFRRFLPTYNGRWGRI